MSLQFWQFFVVVLSGSLFIRNIPILSIGKNMILIESFSWRKLLIIIFLTWIFFKIFLSAHLHIRRKQLWTFFDTPTNEFLEWWIWRWFMNVQTQQKQQHHVVISIICLKNSNFWHFWRKDAKIYLSQMIVTCESSTHFSSIE